MHVKACVFDDQVIFTGANLAETYLSHRQDRYLCIHSPALADSVEKSISILSRAGRDGSDPQAQPALSPRAACRDLSFALRRPHPPPPATAAAAEPDTLAYLCMQAGWAGVRQEEALVSSLAACAAALKATLCVSTPYLNLPARLERQLAAVSDLRILSASPACHGWAGAKGAASMVPAAYAVLAHRTLRRLLRGRPPSEAEVDAALLWEWEKEGAEYHAKGMWWTPPGEAGLGPMATLVGSSNYGLRSSRYDLELNLVLLTRDPGLRARLGAEWEGLAVHARPVGLPQLLERRPGMAVRAAAMAARPWL